MTMMMNARVTVMMHAPDEFDSDTGSVAALCRRPARMPRAMTN
jgi:hypothetical protein